MSEPTLASMTPSPPTEAIMQSGEAVSTVDAEAATQTADDFAGEPPFPRLYQSQEEDAPPLGEGAMLLEALEKRQDAVLEQLDQLHTRIEAVLKEAQPQRSPAPV